MFSLSLGIIVLLAAAVALLYWRCRPLVGIATSSDQKRKQYSAVLTAEPEPEVTSSVSSQRSPSVTSVSNNWSQTIRSAASDVVQNGRGTS